MLFIGNNITRFAEFKKTFYTKHDGMNIIDLSRVASGKLADESDSIVDHHSNCVVFLGYLEPGWMLEPTHQTRLRKLFRKFSVGMVTNFVESLPFSWKNEIDTFFIESPVNGIANTLDNGSSLQD
jgi:hypothetical protein